MQVLCHALGEVKCMSLPCRVPGTHVGDNAITTCRAGLQNAEAGGACQRSLSGLGTGAAGHNAC